MPTEYPDHVQYSKEEVQSEATDVRNRFFPELGETKLALRNLLASLNGRLEYVNGAREETLLIEEDGNFTIFLPKTSSALRDSFTIAHELGHYFLHTNREAEGKVAFSRSGHQKRREWEANWFAADLLMPEKEFKKEAKECANDPVGLAKKFEVSISAADVRLKALRII